MLAAPTNKNSPAVLIHYTGDESLYVPNCHLNSKKNQPYTRTSEKTLNKIKEAVTEKFSKPKVVYDTEAKNAAKNEVLKSREAIYAPRNIQQVKNAKHKVTIGRNITHCEIFSIYEMAKQDLGKFILKLDLIPHTIIIFSEPTTLKLTRDLLMEARANDELPQLLCYDTTFELGDCYVSVLVAKNTYVYGDPIFPVAYMLHDRKLESVHNAFWECLSKKLDLSPLSYNVPICVDREAALANSIRNVEPQANLVFCSNHLRRDILKWILDSKGKPDDFKALPLQISALINCETEEEFERLYATFEEKWTQAYVDYMNKFIKNDLIAASKVNTKKFAAFNLITATNNLSESLNFVIKHALDWKEHLLDALVVKLIELQCTRLFEFSRALKYQGNYRLKPDYIGKLKLNLPPYALLSYHELSMEIKKHVATQEISDRLSGAVASKEVLAARCIDLDNVSFNAKQRIFNVRSIFDNSVHTLEKNHDKEGMKLVCSCNSAECYHKVAVLMSLNEPFDSHPKQLRLNVLRKKSRSHNKKLGRKVPNADDLLDVVQAAADSKFAQEHAFSDDDFVDACEPDVPTITPKRKKLAVVRDLAPSKCEEEHKLKDNDLASIVAGSHDLASIYEDLDDFREPRMNTSSSKRKKSCSETLELKTNVWKDENRQVKKKMRSSNRSQEPGSLDGILVSVLNEPLKEDELRKLPHNYRDLIGEQWLDGETIDHTITQLLRESKTENIKLVPEYIFTSIRSKSYFQALPYAANHLLLNSDALFVAVNPGEHWMLGVIIYTSKCIVLLDSLHNAYDLKKSQVRSLFLDLFVLVRTTFLVAEQDTCLDEWKFVYGNDVPLQRDGTECGVIVCLGVLSILNRVSFPSSETISKDMQSRNRRWIFEVLSRFHNTPNEPESFFKKRFQGLKMQQMTKLLSETDGNISVIVQNSQKIFNEFLSESSRWTICAASSCAGDSDHHQDQFLCVICRQWFHRFCSQVDHVKD